MTKEVCNHNGDVPLRQKIDGFVSKFSWWLVGIVVSILGGIYTSTKTDISVLNDKVNVLYQEKASRNELKALSDELKQQNIELKRDIIKQQDSMKSDILQRLDYLLKIYPPSNTNKQ